MKLGKTTFSFVLIFGFLFLGGGLFATEVAAATYYISVTGSDSSAGSSSAPWKTFSYAIPKLRAGDTLILKNGTYTSATTGFPVINCSAGAANGTSGSPITVKAENERQAFLQTKGLAAAVWIINCNYWTIEGLRAEGADEPTATWDVFDLENSSNLTIRRNLLRYNNRYKNTHLISHYAGNSSNLLFEENEFYNFHRHAIMVDHVNNSTFRRNYCNSRLWADLPNGRESHTLDRGDACMSIYPGSNNLLENNVSENNEYVAEIMSVDTTVGNRILGNISNGDLYGLVLGTRGPSLTQMVRDTVVRDLVSINSVSHGFYARAAKNTLFENGTIIDSGNAGIVTDAGQAGIGWVGDGKPTFYAANSLALNNATQGFFMTDQSDFRIEYGQAYGNPTNFLPSSSDSRITSARTSDPGMGSCKVFIPAGSPLKGAGKDGKDIGANAIYRYENGTLTNTPLWRPDTGQFAACGVQVAGVNDIAGSSCTDVNKRLNVNANGCSLPAGYGGQTSNLTAPTNLRRIP